MQSDWNGDCVVSARKKRSSKPRYRQLAEMLMADITSGRLAVGERMPGELELVERHAVSRHTVRESLRVLEELGLIERHQGLGTVVRANESTPTYVQMVRSPEELLQYPDASRLTVVETETVRTNRALARLLKCRTGMEWTRIGAVRRQRDSGVAIVWSDIYVIPEYADVAAHIGTDSRPVYALIEQEFGEETDAVEVSIEAHLLSATDAARLSASEGEASLVVIRRYTGKDQRQFEVSVSIHPADRFNYSLNFKRGWQSGVGWVQQS